MNKKTNKLLIVGDSYSTFEGYIPEGYAVYYSTKPRPETDVTRVEETWWYPLCEEMKLELVRNDSWSGSPVSYMGWSDSDCSMSSSFIYRVEKLAQDGFFRDNEIDTVLVFGCTNDSWIGTPFGEVKFSGFKRKDFYSVCPSVCYLVAKLKELLPEANIVFMMNTGLKDEISDAIREASKHYGTYCLELEDIDKRSGHPTIKGMKSIKEQVKKFLNENI